MEEEKGKKRQAPMQEAHEGRQEAQGEESPLKVGASTTIPVMEEQLHIDKALVETGRIRISKKIHEQQEEVELPASSEELNIERISVNEYVDTPPPAVRHEGDTMIIPVLREVTVVEKRLLLVEELHVRKRRVETKERQSVSLRREEVRVERQSKQEPDRENP